MMTRKKKGLGERHKKILSFLKSHQRSHTCDLDRLNISHRVIECTVAMDVFSFMAICTNHTFVHMDIESALLLANLEG